MGYRIRVVEPSDLSEAELGAWRALHEAYPPLETPFFSPDFVQLAGAVRKSARVALIEEGSELRGAFPFQHRSGGLGIGIAGPLTDYEGLIAPPDLAVDAREIMQASGLAVLDYANLLADQVAFKPYHEMTDRSHQMDLSKGYQAYVDEMNTPDTKVFADTRAKTRRIDRRVGPLRYEFHDTDPRAFDQLVEWKREQYAATSAIDSLGWSWTLDLLKRIYETQTPSFAGVLSTLYAGDDLIAAHFGMRSRTIFHYWFPAYDNTHRKFSPGMVLLLKIAETAAEEGIRAIDMGAGGYEFKMRLANRGEPIAEGTILSPGLSTGYAARSLSRLTERTFEALPLGRLSSVPRRGFRKWRSYRAYW